MGFMDKIKDGAAGAKAKADEQARQRAEEKKASEAAAAARVAQLADERKAAFSKAQHDCPLPITEAKVALPGGIQLFNDEFLVTTGKDWGWSSQKLSLTTHRVIYSRGRLAKDQESCYLADVRDVKFHKPMIGNGTLAVETAGGHSIEGLPAASNGQRLRDQLLQLGHYARQRAAVPQVAVAAPVASPDRYEQLRKLGELKSQGVLSEEEFQTEKALLLAG